MDKCRICLTSKRKLQSIYNSDNGISFTFMMTSLANIKIVSDDGITEVICKRCCQKLIDAYNFKAQIESSDDILHNSSGIKKICFTNLKDKIQIEIDPSQEITQEIKIELTDCLKEGDKSIVYNNTTIKKIEGEDICIKKESEPLSVVDFLKNFRPESEIDFDNNNDFDNYDGSLSNDDEDPDYDIPILKRKKKGKNDGPLSNDDEDPDYGIPILKRKKKGKKTKAKNNIGSSGKKEKTNKQDLNESIKPVVLADIRVLPTFTPKENKSRVRKKSYQKKQMCNYCGKMTSSIKAHLLVHTAVRSHKCDMCNKTFYTEKALQYHKDEHNKEKKFKCDKCILAFTSQKALARHYVRHLEEKKFVCDVCSKAFKRKRTLSRHQMTHNVANKCIKCDQCNMTFFTKYSLRHHLRIHTGERPYKCELCNQPYSYKHDFNRHCFNKHGIFLKRRSVYVMNEEVMQRERALMRDLMLKLQGFVKEGEPLNPFEGPQAALAFEHAVKALEANNIPLDFN